MIEGSLEKALRELWDNDNFVYCTMKTLPTNENKKEMLQAIRDGIVADATSAMTYSFSIYYDDPFEEDE